MLTPFSATPDQKETFCRNITIYGHCRFEGSTCTFSHNPESKNSNNQTDVTKKTLNVESPSFTPATLQAQPTAKKSTFSSQAASAAVFTPRGAPGTATPSLSETDAQPPAFNPVIREFTPQNNYDLGNAAPAAAAGASDKGLGAYNDPFSMNSVTQSLPATPYNPYAATDHAMAGAGGAAYFQNQTGGYGAPLQPLQYHLYAPIGPYRDGLQAYERRPHDFFMPDKLREDLQKKSHAALQVMPLNVHLDNYHSIVPLDTSQRKNINVFGYSSWVYKATSSKNGNIYCLRRLDGYRLTNEQAIRSVKEWKRVDNGNIVSIIDAFTTRAFGESCLVFAQDYFPLAQTLAEKHLTPQKDNRYRANVLSAKVSENVIWAYIVQISNALKAIHTANLAARCLDPSKIILTDKNRIRLSACAILDVVQFENRRPMPDLQAEDFVALGRLILCLTSAKLPSHLLDLTLEIEALGRGYSDALKNTVIWLLTPASPAESPKVVDNLISGISHQMVSVFDSNLHYTDTLNSELHKELENGRIARLMMKLGVVNERGDFDNEQSWSENGDRYMLKLFRDYVFHRVDERGMPLLDMGHIVTSLNRLDAGTPDTIRLTSRDGETEFYVQFKELNRILNNAFSDLQKGGHGGHSRRN